MSQKKVSVIVPVYNVEKYIKKCVESLINQEYRNFEIILINDGSVDNSGMIIDEMSLRDDQIKVIHQKNQGVSAARNVGISFSKGEYITFVDGDDWVDKDYISYFVSLMEKYGCPVAMNKNNHTEIQKLSNNNSYLISAESAIKSIYMGDIFVAVWNKMYTKKLLEDNQIIFNSDIWYGEGMLFNIECLQYTDMVAIGEKSVYHQTFNTDSAMRKFNLQSNFCGIKSLEIQKKLWKKNNKDIEDAWRYHRYCFNRSIVDGLVRSGLVNSNKSVYKECVSNIRKDIGLPLKMEKSLKKKIVWCGYYVFPNLMAIRRTLKFKKLARLARGGGNRLRTKIGIDSNQIFLINKRIIIFLVRTTHMYRVMYALSQEDKKLLFVT